MSKKCLKYFNLLKKDSILSKSLLFLVVYFLVMILCSPFIFGDNAFSTMLNLIASIILSEMVAFGSQQVLISEKCKGNELIITTTYTRKNIIYARYLFFYVSSLLITLSGFILTSIFYPIVEIHFFNVLEYILLIFCGDAILIPLTFKIKSSLLFTMISFLCLVPVMILINIIESINAIIGILFACVLVLILTVAATIISVKLSEKIYLNKSL